MTREELDRLIAMAAKDATTQSIAWGNISQHLRNTDRRDLADYAESIQNLQQVFIRAVKRPA